MFQKYLPSSRIIIYALICASITFKPSSAFSQAPVLYFELVASGLSSPLDIVRPGDGSNRLFIAEKTGKIRVISNGALVADPFLDISGIISTISERGLLSVAFHPQYATNRFFFVYYTNTAGNIEIARYQASSDPLVALPGSGQVLLTIPHPGQSNHNGGKLNFGTDGNLYFATGDGGGAGDQPNNAQNGNSLLGKMLRINVDNFAVSSPFYTIPPDNPYINDPGVLDEIWALGLRNPFRWSFDRLNQDMWIADVGQDFWEEVNFRPAGSTGNLNYGWRCYEATHPYNTAGCAAQSSYVSPIFEYSHDAVTGGRSVTGGYVYRGSTYGSLYGYYIMADYTSGNVWLLKPDGLGGATSTRQPGLPGGIVGFGEDANGELYAVSIASNSVYQVQVLDDLPVKLVSFSLSEENGMHLIKWQTASEQDLRQFEIQFSTDGIGFQTIGTVAATNFNNGNTYQYSYRIPMSDRAFYRLKIVDNNAKAEYSNIISAGSGNEQAVSIFPTIIKNNQVNIRMNRAFRSLQVLDMNGRVLKTKVLGQSIGMINVDVSDLSRGMYTIRLLGKDSDVYRKIIVQ